MTGFKMDASFDFSSEDVVKSVCEISPLGTFERRCLTPRCSRNLPQAKYRQRSWLLETGASEISSIFAFWRVRMVSLCSVAQITIQMLIRLSSGFFSVLCILGRFLPAADGTFRP